MATPLVLGPMLRYVDETSASIWVETRADCLVTVHAEGRSGRPARFAVHGHHYALVEVDGLQPGRVTPYSLEIDGVAVWPDPDSGYPPSVIATRTPGRRPRMAYGSCRTSVPHDRQATGPTASTRCAPTHSRWPPAARPGRICCLPRRPGVRRLDQRADAGFIRSRRDIHEEPPGEELKDYEEYAHLY